MDPLHSLLERQLKRAGIVDKSLPPTPDAWQDLLEHVSLAYKEVDKDRYLLERSLEISSKEMQEDINERKNAEAALEEATEALKIQNQRLARVNALFRVSVEQISSAVEHGATRQELTEHLRLIRTEFERLDQHSTSAD